MAPATDLVVLLEMAIVVVNPNIACVGVEERWLAIAVGELDTSILPRGVYALRLKKRAEHSSCMNAIKESNDVKILKRGRATFMSGYARNQQPSADR